MGQSALYLSKVLENSVNEQPEGRSPYIQRLIQQDVEMEKQRRKAVDLNKALGEITDEIEIESLKTTYKAWVKANRLKAREFELSVRASKFPDKPLEFYMLDAGYALELIKEARIRGLI